MLATLTLNGENKFQGFRSGTIYQYEAVTYYYNKSVESVTI